MTLTSFFCKKNPGPIIYLPDGFVFLSIENTNNDDQISNCRNVDVQETFTMLPCCLKAVIVVPFSNFFLLQPDVSNFDSSVQITCCHFSAPLVPILFVKTWVSWSWLRIRSATFWLKLFQDDQFRAKLHQMVDGYTQVPMVPTGAKLMALLDII